MGFFQFFKDVVVYIENISEVLQSKAHTKLERKFTAFDFYNQIKV